MLTGAVSTWSVRRPERPLVQAAIVALATLGLLLQGVAMHADANARRIEHWEDFVIKKDLTIAEVQGEGWELGIQPGDRYVKLNGQPVPNLVTYRKMMNRLSLGSTAILTVQRGATLVDLPPIRVVNKGLSTAFFVRNLVCLALVVFTGWAAFTRPENRAARLCFLTGLALGLYLALQGTGADDLVYIQIVALTLAPALAVHFFLTFPRDRLVGWGWRSLLLYIPSLVLMALTLQAYREAMLAGTGQYAASSYRVLSERVDYYFLTGSAILGLVSLGTAYGGLRPIEKRQMQWIMWGLSCAVVAGLVDLMLTLLQMQTPEVHGVVLLALVPLPLAFAFAILRYRLWDIDLVVNRSVVYGLLTAILAAVYLLLVSVFSNALGAKASSGQYMAVIFLSALVIGFLTNPLRARIQAGIDRLFYRRQVNYQHALGRWSEELSTSLRFADLTHLLVREVPGQLLTDRAWLLVLNKEETCLELLSAPGEDADAEPVGQDLWVLTNSPVAVHLCQPGRVLVLHDEDDEDAAAENQGSPLSWRQAGVKVALPLISNGRLVGVYLLGSKLSGDIYQRQELELLRTLANQAAVAITNARLYEQVHALSQELEEKVRSRTKQLRDFVSVVYHELSTPITSVRGFTALLLDGKCGPLTDRQSRYLDVVARNVTRLVHLVGDLSDVSKIEDGRLTIHPEAMDLRLAVEDTLNPLATTIEDKGLQVDVSLPAGGCTVLGDRARVVQILTNLVSNACRYTPAGGQILLCAEKQGTRAEITVRDTGIGIHREDLGHIFERFYRSTDPLVQEQTGTGLGLAITKSLVELHGGQLWVDSTVGKGSVFGFALPLTEGIHEQ